MSEIEDKLQKDSMTIKEQIMNLKNKELYNHIFSSECNNEASIHYLQEKSIIIFLKKFIFYH